MGFISFISGPQYQAALSISAAAHPAPETYAYWQELMNNKLPENAMVVMLPGALCTLQALQLKKWPAGWQLGSLASIPSINSCSGCHD